jgi:hypothetical protein
MIFLQRNKASCRSALAAADLSSVLSGDQQPIMLLDAGVTGIPFFGRMPPRYGRLEPVPIADRRDEMQLESEP